MLEDLCIICDEASKNEFLIAYSEINKHYCSFSIYILNQTLYN